MIPLSQCPGENFPASRDRMKEPNTNGDGRFLSFDGWDFEFYCLQLKNPVGIPKILMLFPVEMRLQCSFPMGMKFQGIFLTEDKFV